MKSTQEGRGMKVEKRSMECSCPLCSQTFTIIETRTHFHDSGYVLEYSPEKVELLPEGRFICENCQKNLSGDLILHRYCRDALWKEIYIFKDLETFYKDFPGHWVRENAGYGNYWHAPIYRILEVWDKHPEYRPTLRFYFEDKKGFDAIQDMPI